MHGISYSCDKKKIFNFFKWFRFVPQSTETPTGIGILRNRTEPENKCSQTVIWSLWYDMEIQCKMSYYEVLHACKSSD